MTTPVPSATPKRLRILDDDEIEALFGRPCFTADDRASYFTLMQPERDLVHLLRSVSSQIAFMLHLGYFKAKQRFFSFTFDEVAEDVEYLLDHYFPQYQRVNLPPLNKRTLLHQHHLILNCVIYYNATILSGLLTHRLAQGDAAGVAMLTHVSPVAWQHINFYGRYEFTKRPEPVDMKLLIQALAQHPNAPVEDVP